LTAPPRTPLLHIIGRADWERACAAGRPHWPAEAGTTGFLHLSTPDTVLVPAGRFYGGRSDLVLVVVDPERLSAELRWEEAVPPEGDLRFPHLYGPLDLDAVVGVVDFPCGPDGGFQLPALPPLVPPGATGTAAGRG
jgi:uncharacterized protein (DUF952 family)